MKVLLTLALLSTLSVWCASAGQPAARYDDFKVYRVLVKDDEQLQEFKKLGNDLPIFYLNDIVGSGRNYDIVIDPVEQKRLEDILKYLEFVYEVTISDLQTVIESLYDRKNGNYSFMDWTQYHSLQEIYDWVDLQTILHKHIEPYIVGYSYEGRPIKGLKLSKRKGNKAIFIESNIHAVEWISSATSTYFLNQLLYSDDPVLKELSEKYDWIFVPILNPDGFVYTHDVARLWRKNRRPTGFSNSSGPCYGIDMNRNFDFHWGGAGWNIDVPCDHWYGGAEPDSEPEVQALEAFVSSFPDNYIRVYIAMHSYGNYLLLPYGHTSTEFPPNYDQMMRIAKSFAEAAIQPYGTNFTYGASGLLNYPVSGAAKDWTYGVKGIPFTCTMELRDKGKYGFFLPANQIVEVGEEVTLGLIALVAKAEEEQLFDV